MAEQLTRKESGFVKDYIETGNGVQSALKNYDTKDYNTAGVIAHENLNKPKIQNAIHAALDDDLLAEKHLQLLNSTTLDNMTFPLGPKTKAECVDDTKLSDEEIRELLLEVNCKVRRIVHSEHARYVYFWCADNKARKDALDMAYKLKGNYAPSKTVSVNVEVEADATLDDVTQRLNALYKGTSRPSDGATTNTMDTETPDKERSGPAN